MKREAMLRVCGCALLAATCAALPPMAQEKKPNVMFILADNVGYGDLGRYGGGELRGAPLFGSLARDEGHPGSDVDLLVEFDGPATFDQFMDLKFFLEDLLSRRVDLVTRAALKPRMRPIIEREAVRVA